MPGRGPGQDTDGADTAPGTGRGMGSGADPDSGDRRNAASAGDPGARPDPAAEPAAGAERSAPQGALAPDPTAGLSAEPRPLGVGTEPTGHHGVDTHLARLADADRLVVGEHPSVYEDVHRGLREELAALDQTAEAPAAVGARPAGPAVGPRPTPPHPSSAPRPRS